MRPDTASRAPALAALSPGAATPADLGRRVTRSRAPFRARWWQWPTVCSLDAPAVCAVWQALLARTAGITLGWPEMTVLALSIWLAYVADRWIEGWRLAPERVLTVRHHFYQRHRWPVAVVWTLVLLADLSVALLRLDRADLLAGVALLGPVLAYVLLHQLLHRNRRGRAPKEVWVAALLSGGVAVFVVTHPAAAPLALAVPLLLFALLCFANCALISSWEHEVDLIHGAESLARQFQSGAAIGRLLPWALAGLSATAVAIGSHVPAATTAAACALASSLLLALVDALERRFGRQLARVLADAALLTPVVPLLAGRLAGR